MAVKRSAEAKAKAKRQKMIAIGGAVLLVALLGIQVPRTMKMLNQTPPPAAASEEPAQTPEAPAETPGAAAPAPADGAAQPAAAIADSDPAASADLGQLISFELFAGKDPFEQQVTASGPSEGSGDGAPADGKDGAAPSGDEEGAGAPETPTTGSGSAPTSGIGSASGGFTAPGTAPPEVAAETRIKINGVEEAVDVKKSFPAADPMFVLVELGPGTVEIALAGGAYANGAETITLEVGVPLTLVNTADGARYELALVAVKGQ